MSKHGKPVMKPLVASGTANIASRGPSDGYFALPEVDLEAIAEVGARVAAQVAASEPAWVGWVYALDGIDGYRRRKVRIPLSWMDDVACGPATGPDLRGTIVMGAMTEAMSDQFLLEMSRAKRGEL